MIEKSLIKPGSMVCIFFKGSPLVNTRVIHYPSRRNNLRADPRDYADLDGIEDPYPVSELHPFNDGTKPPPGKEPGYHPHGKIIVKDQQ